MSDRRTKLLADEICTRLEGTAEGHCVRVDFLEREDALSICRYMALQHQQQESDLMVRVLASRNQEIADNGLFITTDRAVEIRNRKQGRLCLFVPSDLVDAAYSSLANSFALIDGQTLFEAALKKEAKKLSRDAQRVVSFVGQGTLKASYEQRLDFAVTAQIQGNDELLGLELWRVGLIADARPDFFAYLTSNRNCTILLSRPMRLDATAHERIQSLKVNKETANALGKFFRNRSMNDISSWSYELAREGTLTFDRWIFPATDRSDIKRVDIQPFINARGVVEKFCRLLQPDAANGSLQAICGPKGTMVAKWSCDPPQPQNLSGWSVRIVPSDYDAELAEDSDFIEPKIPRVPASRRTVTIKLDMEEDETPTGPVCVRVAPLDATGNELIDKETGEVIADKSTEFFLVRNLQIDVSGEVRENRSIVPTLSYGRLEAAIKLPEGQTFVEEQAQPQWIARDLFSLTLSNKTILTVGVSETLIELERQVRDNPRDGGCFTLAVDEVVPVGVTSITPYPLQSGDNATWSAFWKARETFFSRLKKQPGRDTIETTDWTLELATVAVRYAQEYQKLLDGLIKNRCERTEMLDALSIDSLLVQLSGKGDEMEEAVVILPTHPLRVAWMVSYTQLLRRWEEDLLALPKSKRRNSIDQDALRMLTPTNVPAFSYHAASKNAFLFFQNIRLYHGVALPAAITDPRRHYTNVAYILGSGFEQSGIGDILPNHLKEHLVRFSDSHPYTRTLVTTLVNPDRGDFFAEAVRLFLDETTHADEQEEARSAPSFQITAYMPDEHPHSLSTLEQKLQRSDQRHEQVTDYFLPGLSTTVRPSSRLARRAPEAHLAVVTDLTRPSITVGSQTLNNPEMRAEISSFSLYGLITRFIPQFTTDEQGLLWNYHIIPEGIKRPEPHPVSPRYSETLLELHQSLLDAQGYLVSKHNNACPMLEVRIEQERKDLLENLHTNTNWVITLDRFFALDYYDSPHTPELRSLAQKYVLDYSPESLEGFGHRMMVTTAWHEEIETLLAQAMEELGFSSVDQSVGQLLHYLKTVSGRLALQALDSSTNAAAAVGLGVVTAWLQKQGKLKDSVLIPVDIYPRIFSLNGTGKPQQGERRCDMVLVSLRRDIVDATFIEVKWRRGQAPLQELASDMTLQMESSAQAMYNRFFNERRVDGTLQRSYLANVLKFYFERSRRYKLIDPNIERPFLERLARLEKTGLEFRPTYEGYIVNLEGQPRNKPIEIDAQPERAKITVLTARDFYNADTSEFSSLLNRSAPSDVDEVQTIQVDDQEWVDSEVEQDASLSNISSFDTIDDDTVLTTPTEKLSAGPNDMSPEEVFVPLGESVDGPVEWKPSTKGSPHLFIIGIPGQGKSWTTTRILNELGKQQVPTLVLDFHGQFADPHGSFMRTIHPSVVDAAKGLPFSPFECNFGNDSGGWKANSYALAEIFAYVTNMGQMQRDLIYTALQDTYKAHGFTDDEEEGMVNLDYPTSAEVLRRIERKEQERHINNVAARCRPLLEMNLFRPIKDAPDMLTSIREGLVIDLHNLYAEELQLAGGAFVLRKLYRDMFHWGNADRLRLAIVLDEAHRLAKDVTLPKLMKEGRKFGIAVIVASQGINDFHQDILSNAGTKVIFRVNYPDSKKVAGFIRGHAGLDLAERIEQLQVGSAYVQTPEMPYGSLVHMYPLEEE
jgi:DNA phosphorothioation-dependent restriction protein DptH